MTRFVDCTLRDGGYYNGWDFSDELIFSYLHAVESAGVDVVELGFRSLKREGFKGACAYTTESFLQGLPISDDLLVAVMVNAAEFSNEGDPEPFLEALFPLPASSSRVDLVRVACHFHEFEKVLPVSEWLKERGFRVGFNLMQVADRSRAEICELASKARAYPIDVLYFADSMGSMNPDDIAQMIDWFCEQWSGEIGVHTHDNLGLALSNTLKAIDKGVTWVDATVAGMGRGPGNAKTEELAIEIAERRGERTNLVPLMTTLRQHFSPLQHRYGWGTNPYYYLAGKFGIHPSYIQEMLGDPRYNEEDILAVIDHLRQEGGKKFSLDTLDGAKKFYRGKPVGSWNPTTVMHNREVLVLGTGPGVERYEMALKGYIRRYAPIVLALNTQQAIPSDLIDFRVACHPVRLLADCETHAQLPQPLITPASMLPSDVRAALEGKELLDFGLNVQSERFAFYETSCVTPTSQVVAYVLAVVTSGEAKNVVMAGFDGYGPDDPRNYEMDRLLEIYREHPQARPLLSITPTRYRLPSSSVYAYTQ